MNNFETFYELLRLSLISGAISTLFVQKIKCHLLKNDCVTVLASFIISLLIGTSFALTFTNYVFKYAIWVGVFTFVGAEAIFNLLKKTTNIKTLENIKKEGENNARQDN